MSAHPNAILLLTLTPNGLSRKTMRNILDEEGVEGKDFVKIGGENYNHVIMERDYDEYFQLSAKEGDLHFFSFATYGYGEKIAWDKLEAHKKELEEWAKGICERHSCSYEIFVTANFW